MNEIAVENGSKILVEKFLKWNVGIDVNLDEKVGANLYLPYSRFSKSG